jgi:hypothetical protein
MMKIHKLATSVILAFVLAINVAGISAQTATPAPTPTTTTTTTTTTPTPTPRPPTPPPPAPPTTPPSSAGQTVRLYYFREATKVAAILNAIASRTDPPSPLKGLIIGTFGEDEIVLYGALDQRNLARRIIATLDLPRPGVTMEMWGIQISSRKPEKMALVMPEIRTEINRTQSAVRDTYDYMQQLARQVVPDGDLDPVFNKLLTGTLAYRSALESQRPFSLTDILLRLVASKNPGRATSEMANRLNSFLAAKYPENVESVHRKRQQPFERFFNSRGLAFEGNQWVDQTVGPRSNMGRVAVLEFGFHYGRLIQEPDSFSPYFLQQAAESLNSRLQDAVDALNLDMQDLFVEPTLKKIQGIVKDRKDVEYAQVGKTSVAGLSGTDTVVTSKSVNAFDVTPPLRLSDLLAKGKQLSDAATPFVPKPADNLVGAMPLAQVIGLIGALGEERSVWRELSAGISLTITPTVLRNMNSAELAVDLKTGDPQAGTREAGVRPLSRVSQHDVKTKVYVNALDFFDLSAFASQSTLNGGRGYVPIVGPVWQGLFGSVPVAGKLFSWEKAPQTVFTESLVLTNSFITPTVMGIAVLYPIEPDGQMPKVDFDSQSRAINNYRNTLLAR